MTTKAPRIDGRSARAERTRDAVVEAFLALIDQGYLQPTARQVSVHAGVSLRSVFQHFADMETLFAAAADRQIERLRHLAVTVDPKSPFEERLAAFIEARARLLETMTPVRRAALLGEPFSPEIGRRLHWSREMNREETERVFAAELRNLPKSERRLVSAALHASTEWYTWETLRVHDGMPYKDAARAMALTVRSLLRKETP